MRSGVCPKCNGTNIYTNIGINRFYGDRTGISVSVLKTLTSTVYICTDCRYIEEYIDESDNLEKIKKVWNRV